MHRRVVMLALAGSAAAFMPGAFVGSTPALAKATSGEPPRCLAPSRRALLPRARFSDDQHGARPGLRLRSGRTSIKMVDWDWDKKEEEDNYDGPGSERGQVSFRAPLLLALALSRPPGRVPTRRPPWP